MVLDEGFQFGLGAFETIAVQNGRAILVKSHIKRLNDTLKMLQIDRQVSTADIALEASKNEMEWGVLKVMVSEQNILFIRRANPYKRAGYQTGYQMEFSDIRRNETSPLVRHKTLNYGDCIMERRRAVKAGLDEMIFQNTRGEICEGTASNIFFVCNGKLITPAVTCGLLPGIIRGYICEHFDVTECVITRGQIDDFDECFVTNSLLGIMPVVKLGSRQFEKRSVTEMITTQYLHQILRIKDWPR